MRIFCKLALPRMIDAARCWWLTSIILPTQEAEIRRISHAIPGKQFPDPILKTHNTKKG
jgi:hypothetical protein